MCFTTGQGCIPDIPGADEHYPVSFEIYYDASDPYEGKRLWERGIRTHEGERLLFVAYWSAGEYNGEQVAVEEFMFWGAASNIVHSGTAYLEPILGSPNRPLWNKEPLTWQSAGYAVNGKRLDSLIANQVQVRFETIQTGPYTIRTTGTFIFAGRKQGRIVLEGSCSIEACF
ncbi:MAG: hypothetical protein GXP42_09595 [Chloroflexi bacterium]|nr:hypothetical protein [Chloroflexota bacterium]